MLGNRDGNGRDGFGNDFFAILLLFILMGWGGNNNGGFFGNRGNGGGEGLNILNNVQDAVNKRFRRPDVI